MERQNIYEFSFENSFENLKELPVKEDTYLPIHWVKISSRGNLTIFPDMFEGKSFVQGKTGLCFYFPAYLPLPQFQVLFTDCLVIMIIGDRQNHL